MSSKRQGQNPQKSQPKNKKTQAGVAGSSKDEVARSAADATEYDSENPYIVAIANRKRNLTKKISQIEELEREVSGSKDSIPPNQRQKIQDKPKVQYAVDELTNILDLVRSVNAEVTKREDEDKMNTMLDLTSLLLLPVYLSGEDADSRCQSLLNKEPELTKEKVQMIFSLREFLLPTSVEKPLAEVIREKADFLLHLEAESTRKSPIGPTYKEIRETLHLIHSTSALNSLPQPPKAKKAAKPQQKEAPAEKPEEKAAPAEPKEKKQPKKPKEKAEVKPAEEEKPAPPAEPAKEKKEQPQRKEPHQPAAANPHVYHPKGAAQPQPKAEAKPQPKQTPAQPAQNQFSWKRQ